MDGLVLRAISNATNLVVGEAQIHAPKYLTSRSLYKSLPNPDSALRALEEKNVAAALRSYGYGLVAYRTKSAGALFWGIDPATERLTFDLAENVAEGRFLSDTPQKGMVLGKKLARSLNATVGSEIVVVVQAADGSLGNELYFVTGILKAIGESIDRNAAILHGLDFEELFVSGGRVHEIAVNSKGILHLDELTALVSKAAPNMEVKTWRKLMPALSDMVNLFDASIWIFGLIFFLAAGLGVMNTMLMATFERMREFGMIKALGGTPWRILRDVAAEALVLGLFATTMGALLGLAGSLYFQETGLDTSAFAGEYSIAGVAFDPVWRAVVSLKTILIPVVAMWVICLAASVYPAALAARLDPVRAIHRI
jgi:ABC-type lipoprotein release transport system permease subunit